MSPQGDEFCIVARIPEDGFVNPGVKLGGVSLPGSHPASVFTDRYLL
jgi:hypothetical protein